MFTIFLAAIFHQAERNSSLAWLLAAALPPLFLFGLYKIHAKKPGFLKKNLLKRLFKKNRDTGIKLGNVLIVVGTLALIVGLGVWLGWGWALLFTFLGVVLWIEANG